MHVRDRLALALPPLFLRLALAAVFVWAGYVKVFTETTFPPEAAATLANRGVYLKPVAPAPAPATPDAPPATVEPKQDDPKPTAPPPPAPEAKPNPADQPADSPVVPEEPLPEPGESPASADPAAARAPRTIDVSLFLAAADAPAPAPAEAPAAAPAPQTADDFPEPVKATRRHYITLMLIGAANPPDGKTPTWPSEWAKGRVPVYFAHAVAWTELVGGLLVFFGLFTRLGALALAGVMAGALWLASIGPAIAGPGAFLGFLPPIDYDARTWGDMLFQLTLFLAALALMFSRPGWLSIDSILFGGHAEPRQPKK